jgi:hypothetical protein
VSENFSNNQADPSNDSCSGIPIVSLNPSNKISVIVPEQFNVERQFILNQSPD